MAKKILCQFFVNVPKYRLKDKV